MTDFVVIIPCSSGQRWGLNFANVRRPWVNLHLVRLAADGTPFKPAPGQHFAEKRALWIGWDGNRFCRNRDARWAEDGEPDLLEKLGRYLKQHHADKAA